MTQLANVKITVLKKAFYPEMADQYIIEGRDIGPCPLCEEGDSYVFKGSAEMPVGLCPWAWIDIYRTISAMASGATNSSWNNKPNQEVVCCTDGVRPVTFLVERIEE